MIATSSITPPAAPMRTCVGCRQVAPQDQLLRLAVIDERVVPDPGRRAPGRGVYVHAQPDCLRAAGKGGLARSLKRGVSRAELDAIAGVAAASKGGANAVERAPHLPPTPRPPSTSSLETDPNGRTRHGAHGA
ncbi:MAG: YlxR family protein [Myxococcales bacterium]|nr:YlxR family protein [Myxococcales bacterium]